MKIFQAWKKAFAKPKKKKIHIGISRVTPESRRSLFFIPYRSLDEF
jgi:hypothetical protein